MKIIKTEELRVKRIDVPLITGVYDPLSGKRDGTITPQSPLMVFGSNLDMVGMGDFSLCLVTAVDFVRIIVLPNVQLCAEDKVIVMLPFLEPGEYFPAVLIEKEESAVYILPQSLVVK